MTALLRHTMRWAAAGTLLISRAAFGQEAVAPAQSPAPISPESAAQPSSASTGMESPAPPAIGLADAVHRALARNPTAVTAYEEVTRAMAIVEQARSASLPTLSAVGEYIRLDGDRIVSGEVFVPANQLTGNLTLTVPIVAPKSWAQWSHASDAVDVSRASAADVRRTVAVAVARAYLTIVAQKRVIEAAELARDTDKAHFDFAHRRLVGGVGNRIDEVRADQQLAGDEANVEQQQATLTKDREALGVLVGVGGPLDAEEPNLRSADARPATRAGGRGAAERREGRGLAPQGCPARGSRRLDRLFALSRGDRPAVPPRPPLAHGDSPPRAGRRSSS